MKQVVYGGEGFFIPWLCERAGGSPKGMVGVTIGLWDTETDLPVACVMYESFNGASIVAHIASDGSKAWLSRPFLRAIFSYAFDQAGCQVILAPVASSNEAARKFLGKLSFSLAATIPEAHPSGSLLIFSLRRAACRWLEK